MPFLSFWVLSFSLVLGFGEYGFFLAFSLGFMVDFLLVHNGFTNIMRCNIYE